MIDLTKTLEILVLLVLVIYAILKVGKHSNPKFPYLEDHKFLNLFYDFIFGLLGLAYIIAIILGLSFAFVSLCNPWVK